MDDSFLQFGHNQSKTALALSQSKSPLHFHALTFIQEILRFIEGLILFCPTQSGAVQMDVIRDIYGVEVSDTTVSRVTDKIPPIAKEWQQRPLETVYAVVFLDAIHFHVRSEGQIVKKAVYIAIGIS